MKSLLCFCLTLLCSCGCMNEHIDLEEANEQVALSPEDLQNFDRLRISMIQDISKIREIHKDLQPPRKWISTNRYYLDKVNAVKYATLLTPLKNKMEDYLKISSSGDLEVVLKERVQHRYDDYNRTYTHLLVRIGGKDDPLDEYANIQQIYLDSAIVPNWRYVYFMSYTGH